MTTTHFDSEERSSITTVLRVLAYCTRNLDLTVCVCNWHWLQSLLAVISETVHRLTDRPLTDRAVGNMSSDGMYISLKRDPQQRYRCLSDKLCCTVITSACTCKKCLESM